jgi:WD40 repeat protein
VAFVLEGHIQGVLTMDCMQSILLSSGFEYQAYCWSIASRSLLVTLGGHQHRLIGAKFVSNRSNASVAIAVTGDESGHFKLWDLSRCVRGSTTDLTRMMQTFEIRSPSLCLFRTFSCGLPGSAISASSSDLRKAKATEGELLDIITGNLHLYRFQAITQAEESAPPRYVVFNSVTNTFLGSVDGCITVWNANSGAKMEEPIHIRDADVCGIVFDLPRERKLFIATSVSELPYPDGGKLRPVANKCGLANFQCACHGIGWINSSV